MNARIACVVLALAVAMGASAPASAEDAPKKPIIQIAILLDNSGSMSGLISQAKTQLWQLVNEFITMKRDGLRPEIQVALFTYGDPPARQLLALTTDLDAVSQALFAVTISGGTEYCGQVIKTATDTLAWDKDPTSLKVIFIAGNEPFTQGEVDYREACKGAIAKGIIVNTIHCGSEAEGVSGKWNEGATLADGRYMCINQNRAVVAIVAPQDKRLAELSVELNKTYVPYGQAGQAGAASQVREDSNAGSVSPSNTAERAVTKGSQNYRNAGWDLVDAVAEGKVKVAEVKVEELPENMQKMDVKEREKYVAAQQQNRAAVQKEIADLAEARRKHIAEETKKLADKGEDTLGAQMRDAAKLQAAEKNIK